MDIRLSSINLAENHYNIIQKRDYSYPVRIQNDSYSPSFQHHFSTHGIIANYVITAKEFPRLHKYKEIILSHVQKPDFTELGTKFLGAIPTRNNHFYSPKKKGSFWDKDGENNAFAYYKKHVAGMLKAVEDGDIDAFLLHGPYALHYLQDMGQPLHTQRCDPFFVMFRKSSVHHAFEKEIKKSEIAILLGYERKPFTYPDFDKLFLDTAEFSSNMELPLLNNKWHWLSLARRALIKTTDVTCEFAAKMEKLLQKLEENATRRQA